MCIADKGGFMGGNVAVTPPSWALLNDNIYFKVKIYDFYQFLSSLYTVNILKIST